MPRTPRIAAGKLARIRALCGRLGVRMEPGCVRGVWVVPLFSWCAISLFKIKIFSVPLPATLCTEPIQFRRASAHSLPKHCAVAYC